MPQTRQGANQVQKNSEGDGGSAPKGRRQVLVGPWHFCARCGSRIPIADLEWQNGLLLCNSNWFDCIDAEVVGERDALIKEAVEAPTEELMPDEKLTSPDILDEFEDFIA